MNIWFKPLDCFLTRKSLWMVFVGIFAISFSVALYTNSAWEDWYITYRASKNLAMGNGLVYTVGQRVHSFTSPIGTLIPALLSFVSGNRSDDAVLWLFRAINCALLGFAGIMLLRIAQVLGMKLLPAAVMLGLFATDAKIIEFSIDGQETAFMMFFLVATLYSLTVPAKNFILLLGASCAGLMWTRPDSFIYIGALALGYILFNPESPHFSTRVDMMKKFVAAGMVTSALYLPWTVWTWYYYGSPIPHTIIAKIGFGGHKLDKTLLAKFLAFPYETITGSSSVISTFMPSYFFLGGWPGSMFYYCGIIGLFCTYYWCLPYVNSRARAVSFAVFLGHFYLSHVTSFIYPWYIPSVALLSIFVIGQFIEALATNVISNQGGWFPKKAILSLGGLMLIVVSMVITLLISHQMKHYQEIIEESNRKHIGTFLRENAATSHDTVFVECLGYIGYYSQLKMYDFPGLSSPEVIAARRKLNTGDYSQLIQYLHPDWLVLRPFEIEMIQSKMPDLLTKTYQTVKEFDVSDKVNSYSFLPGRGWLQYDQTFVVYRRNSK